MIFPFLPFLFALSSLNPGFLLSPLNPFLSLPLFVASLGILPGSPLLASHCPFFSFSSCSTSPLCSSPLLLLSFPLLLSPASSLPLKLFAQRGSAQRGSTLRSSHPKGSLAAMSSAFRVGAAYDLQLSSCAFSMCRLRSRCQLCCWRLRTTCSTFVSF